MTKVVFLLGQFQSHPDYKRFYQLLREAGFGVVRSYNYDNEPKWDNVNVTSPTDGCWAPPESPWLMTPDEQAFLRDIGLSRLIECHSEEGNHPGRGPTFGHGLVGDLERLYRSVHACVVVQTAKDHLGGSRVVIELLAALEVFQSEGTPRLFHFGERPRHFPGDEFASVAESLPTDPSEAAEVVKSALS